MYNARQALYEENISEEKLAKLNNLVAELEKNTVNLGAVITEKADDALEETGRDDDLDKEPLANAEE